MGPVNWSGYLFSHPKGESLEPIVEDRFVFEPSNNSGLIGTYKLFLDMPLWHVYEFKTLKPLMGEDKYDLPIEGPYYYPLLFIFSDARLIILAQRKSIVSYVKRFVLDKFLFPNLRYVKFNLDAFVGSCLPVDSLYRVTSLYGRVATSSRNIKSINLHGDNVTDSEIYKKFGEQFNYISCGIGHNMRDELPIIDPNDEGEVILVGNDGFIHSKIPTEKRAEEMLKIVKHIVKNGWIDPKLNF